MSSKPTLETQLGADWADDSQSNDKGSAAKPTVWGAPKKEAPAAVDFRKLQEEQTKPKEAAKPSAYRPPARDHHQEERHEDNYAQNDYQRGGDYRPRDDNYGGQRREYPRRDDSYAPRDYQKRDEYAPRDYQRRDDNYERGPREQAPVPDHPPFTARLGNLNYEMTDEYLADYFTDLGIVSAHIAIDRDTGKSRGFGFVEFTTKEGLENALLCNDCGQLFMERPFQVSVYVQKKDSSVPRYGFGAREGGEEPKSFRRDPDRPFEPARPERQFGRGFGGNEPHRGYGRDGPGGYGRDGPGGYGRDGPSRYGRDDAPRSFDRPTGPPSLGLKPRSEQPARDPSPPKKKLSEDPFGGASVDEEKEKRIREERDKRAQEREQRLKDEVEQRKVREEKERQDRLAKAEEEKKKRAEAQPKSWRTEDQQKPAGSAWGKPRTEAPPAGKADVSKNWAENKKAAPEAKPEEPKGEGEFRSPGAGRGAKKEFHSPKDGEGRGKKPVGRGAGGRGDSPYKNQKPQGGPKGPNPNKPKPEEAAEGKDSFVTPKDYAKPPSYKAALGVTAGNDKKATENPFQALMKGDGAPEAQEQ